MTDFRLILLDHTTSYTYYYYFSLTHFLDLFHLFCQVSVVCMAFYLYRTMTVDAMIEELLSRPDDYADFEFLGYWASVFNNVIAVAVFLAWIKV